MRYLIASCLLLSTFALCGCGSSESPTVPDSEYSAGAAFCTDGKPAATGGTVKVDTVGGVPQLTVDVYGEKP